MRSIGSSLFKPQTVLFAPEPRRGTRRNSAAGGLEHASCASVKKGGKCEAFHASLFQGRYSEAIMSVRRLAEP